MHSIESRCYKTRKYTVCRHVHASFSPEILQAGAVKGLTSTETTRLTKDGEKGGEGAWRWGKRYIIYLSLHCHHQNDSRIEMGAKKAILMFH